MDAFSRRALMFSGLAGGVALARAASSRGSKPNPMNTGFTLEEATIGDLQQRMDTGVLTARSIAAQYLDRIEAMDKRGPAINAVIELNPDALAIADALDAERKAKGPRGPMHGIPILIKDNIATADKLQTTAGSLALVGSKVPRDAFIVERLRAAGAVILGKTNLSEWANFRSTHSTSGWSGRGGLTRNPYALDRNTSGSSSGSGAACAANFCAAAVGTETDGSIVSPSQCNSLVGLKPTVGLLSRSGIVPISHTQDTAGPMCRTVRDAAILLSAMAGADPRDPATAAGRALPDYTKALDPDGLRGARIGVLRGTFAGYSAVTDAVVQDSIRVLRQQGAVIVDPAELPHATEYSDDEQTVLLFEFKEDLNRYLAGLVDSPVRTLAEVIAFNELHRNAELQFFGQELMLQAQAKGPLTEKAYLTALERCRRLARSEGIDVTMTALKLDALVAATGAPPWLSDLVDGDYAQNGSTTPAAVAGYPSITVPAGSAHGLPIGLSFMGRAYSEPLLLKLAYSFEQATKARRAPKFLRTIEL
jgi:amidase